MKSRLVVALTFLLLVPVYVLLYLYYDPQISQWAVEYAKQSGVSLNNLLFFSDTAGHNVLFYLVFVFFWIAVLGGGKSEHDDWRKKIFFVAVSVAVAVCLYSALKYTFGRYRPEELYNRLYGFNWLQGTSYSRESTPSGHSARAFAFAVSVSMVAGKRWISGVLIFYAVAIALSRLFLGAHFLSDVLFGSWVGFASAALVYPFIFSKSTASVKND